MVKPPSAKSKAAKAKREKMTVKEPLADAVREKLEKSWADLQTDDDKDKKAPMYRDTGWIERSYPSTASLEESDFLTAEEALASEEQLLGKRGDTIYEGDELNDDVPDFLQMSVKAGPPASTLNHLGQTPAEQKNRKDRKVRKPIDAIALGEAPLPVLVNPEGIKRAVTILRDHDLQYPDLYMAVYVAPDWAVHDDAARFARLFARSGCYRADSIEEADLVVFGGGSDIEPLLYGEKNEDRHDTVYFDTERDASDMAIYLKARNQGTPMMGVCRGAQFLHVMNGGKLYQHIDGHQGAHKGFAMREKLLIEQVSSVHHQSCIFNRENGMELLMTTANASTYRWLNKNDKDLKPKIDVEAFYYRDTGCFGVQGHPEYSTYNKYSVWCLEQLSNLFLCSPDFGWSGKRLQMTAAAKDAKAIAEQYIENAYAQSKEA